MRSKLLILNQQISYSGGVVMLFELVKLFAIIGILAWADVHSREFVVK